jgi:hypothetical protein
MLCWNRSWAVLRDSTATLSEHCQTLVTNNVNTCHSSKITRVQKHTSMCRICQRQHLDSKNNVTSLQGLVKDSDFSSKRYHVCTQSITKNYWHQVHEALPADPILLLQAYNGYREQVTNQYLLQHTHKHTHTHTHQIFVLNKTFLILISCDRASWIMKMNK